MAICKLAASKNPRVVLGFLDLIAREVDGRPMAPSEGGGIQRVTKFVYEGAEEARLAPPGA